MTDQTTLVTFLLDRSSSMGSCWDATIEAFNGYIDGLRQATTPILFTHLQFDSQAGCEINKVCFEQTPAAVANLTRATYRPRGGTPLIEAATKTILALQNKLASEKDQKPKMVVCIQTDGEENQSAVEYTWARLKALIEQLTADGWQFNFMGAGVDAYDQQQRYATAAAMGVSTQNSMGYNSTDKHATRAAFAASSANTMAFASGARADTSYDLSQRIASGDIRGKGAPLTGTPPVPTGALPRSLRPVMPADLDLGGGPPKSADLDLTR